MIYNDELLFIHAPKTAGMSLTDALLRGLRGQVYITVPHGHGARAAGEVILEGRRHETLPMAAAHFAHRGEDLRRFQAIVAVVRNPYDLELSRFHYLRKGHAHDRGAAQDLALAGDFGAFALKSRWWFGNFADFYTLDGRMPDTLRVLRFENLAADFDAVCSGFLTGRTPLPRLNATEHGTVDQHLTPSSETAIFQKYRWLFDTGFYPRHRF